MHIYIYKHSNGRKDKFKFRLDIQHANIHM